MALVDVGLWRANLALQVEGRLQVSPILNSKSLYIANKLGLFAIGGRRNDVVILIGGTVNISTPLLHQPLAAIAGAVSHRTTENEISREEVQVAAAKKKKMAGGQPKKTKKRKDTDEAVVSDNATELEEDGDCGAWKFTPMAVAPQQFRLVRLTILTFRYFICSICLLQGIGYRCVYHALGKIFRSQGRAKRPSIVSGI
jgi:hypothetical protein